MAAGVACAAPLIRGARERWQSEAIAAAKEQGRAGRCGGIFASTSQRRPHAPVTAWQRPTIHNGGAVRFTNTKDTHRRRKRGAGA